MDLKTSGDWPLPSGVWQLDDAGVWTLQRSADGQNVSPLLSNADIGKLMHARRLPGAAGAPVRQFPPEFAFASRPPDPPTAHREAETAKAHRG